MAGFRHSDAKTFKKHARNTSSERCPGVEESSFTKAAHMKKMRFPKNSAEQVLTLGKVFV